MSFTNLLDKNGHANAKISYLKMDIEGNELKCLPSWLESGALENVQQIGLEFHLDNQYNNYRNDLRTTANFIDTLKNLYFHGNYRLISYEANGCAKNSETNKGRNRYFNLAEIVLKKIPHDHSCSV